MEDRELHSLKAEETDAGLARLAADTALDAPAWLETRLRAAVRERRQARRRQVWRMLGGSVALAALAFLLVAGREKPQPQQWSDIETAVPVTPWFYNTALPRAGGGRVMRVAVAPATAVSFGVAPSLAERDIEAEVYLGEDGLVRAVRFVR